MLKKLLSLLLVFCCFWVFAATGLAQSAVTITELSICKRIQDREPVDAGTSFSNDVGKLYCFTRVSAVEKASIKHVWYLDGEKRPSSLLQLGLLPPGEQAAQK